ncbi:MAG: hypothetical protein OEY52_00455 [Gammaproteobacteria bacterium]|nr:hypothetical protein [Gammaproteobacteria bacterium]
MSRVSQAVYFLGLLFWFVQASAEQAQEELPSMELLEFLGDSEQVDGEWFDPLDMIEMQENDNLIGQQENQEND